MAVDNYGSYTNNDLIYEAVTGQPRDPTEGSNKYTPLNTPIISASITKNYAIINLVGVMLRFVSLDNGVTTPSYFNVPSSNLITIKDNLIWDIYLDGYVADKVAAVEYSIMFIKKGDTRLYSIDNSNAGPYMVVNYTWNDYYGGYWGKSTNSQFIHFVSFSGYQYYNEFYEEEHYTINITSDRFETDINNLVSFLGYQGGSSYTYCAFSKETDGFNWNNSNKAKWVSTYHNKYSYVSDTGELMIKGTFNYFNPITGSIDSTGNTKYTYNSFTKSTLFSSYNISKAWLYDNSLIVLTTNNLILVAGDNRNSRLTPDNDNDFITSPYIIDIGDLYDIIIDKGLSSGESYLVLYSTLSESGNKLNIKQNTYSSDLKISNLTQIQSISGSIGRQVTTSDFYTKSSITLPSSHEVIWFRWDVTVPENTGLEESLDVTLGPYIEWDYDPDLI